MSMLCPKCGAEVYREDNYECPCEDQQPCPTCGCDTYNETGRCESALQLTKTNKRITELENVLSEARYQLFETAGRMTLLPANKIFAVASREIDSVASWITATLDQEMGSDGQKEWVPNLAEYHTLARRCEKLESQLTEAKAQIEELEDRVKELEDMWEPMADAMLRELSTNHGKKKHTTLHRQLGRIVGVILTPRSDRENVLRMMHKIAYLEAKTADRDREMAFKLAKFTGPPYLMMGKCELMLIAWRLYDIGVVAQFQAQQETLQARVEELEKAGAFNEFRDVMLKVHNLLGVSTDQTFKDIAGEMYTKIENLQARIDAAVVEYERPHVPTTSALNAMLDRLLGPFTGETGKGDG